MRTPVHYHIAHNGRGKMPAARSSWAYGNIEAAKQRAAELSGSYIGPDFTKKHPPVRVETCGQNDFSMLTHRHWDENGMIVGSWYEYPDGQVFATPEYIAETYALAMLGGYPARGYNDIVRKVR